MTRLLGLILSLALLLGGLPLASATAAESGGKPGTKQVNGGKKGKKKGKKGKKGKTGHKKGKKKGKKATIAIA